MANKKRAYSARLEGGRLVFKEVEGYPVEIHGIPALAYKTEKMVQGERKMKKETGWYVIDIRTGLSFSAFCPTKKAAIESALYRVGRYGVDKVLKLIENTVRQYGEAPKVGA